MSNSYANLVSTLRSRAAQTPGANKDLRKCFAPNSQYCFSDACKTEGEKMGIDWVEIFTLPQKQIFRMTGFVNALTSGVVGDFDYTHARILCAMRLAGAYDLTTGALTALTAGVRVTTANTRGITSDAVNRMFSRSHKLGTVQTKISNMTGKNGFSQVTGMTFAPPTQDHAIALNLESALVKAFFAVIDKATTGQIDAMNDAGIKE